VALLGASAGGYATYLPFNSATQPITTADEPFTLTPSSVGTDPGGTSITESVVDMVPGDFRERLVTLAPVSSFEPAIGYRVSASLLSDGTPAPVSVSVGGDAVNNLDGTNLGMVEGQPSGQANAGQGGLFVDVWECAGTWSSVDGAIASRTDDRDYTCSTGGNGTFVASTDVPTTGWSATHWIYFALKTSRTLLIRTHVSNDGTTDGRQNVLLDESLNVTHEFVAGNYYNAAGSNMFASAPTFVPQIGGKTTATFDLRGATQESGEPNPNGRTEGWWFNYTPTVNQTVNLTALGGTTGGGYGDNVVYAYTGSSVNALAAVGITQTGYWFSFSAIAGTTYRLRVSPDIYATLNGEGRLFLTAGSLESDDFASAAALTLLAAGTESAATFDLRHATLQHAEIYGNGRLETQWWSYTPTMTQVLNVGAAGGTGGGSFYTGIETRIFTGTAVNNVSPVATSDIAYTDNKAFVANAGTTYLLRAQSGIYATLQGRTTLTIRAGGLANDNFADAAAVAPMTSGQSSSSSFDMRPSTFEVNEPGLPGANTPGRSMWWSYTPASNQSVWVGGVGGVPGGTYQGWVPQVYTGSTLATLATVTTTAGPVGDQQTFAAVAGTTYRIRMVPDLYAVVTDTSTFSLGVI
jgi:hypothetical protein